MKSETKVTLTATSLDGGGASYEMEFVIIPKVEAIEIYVNFGTSLTLHPLVNNTLP